jgi:hypothetical protein
MFAQVLSSIANALLQVPAQDALVAYRYLSDPITARCKVHFIRQMEALYLERFLVSSNRNSASMRTDSDTRVVVDSRRKGSSHALGGDSDDDIDDEDEHVFQVVAGDLLRDGVTSGATQSAGEALAAAPFDSCEEEGSLGVRSDRGSSSSGDSREGRGASEADTDSTSDSSDSSDSSDFGGGEGGSGGGAGGEEDGGARDPMCSN